MFIIAVLIWSQLGLVSTKAADGFTTTLNEDGLTLTITGHSYPIQNTDLVIPNKLVHEGVERVVTAIGDYALNNFNLTSLTFEPTSDLVEIGESAFASNLLDIVSIPSSVKKIGKNAFTSNQLESVIFDLQGNVEYIGKQAFYTNELTEVVLPSSVRTIDEYAFASNKLEKVEFKQPQNPPITIHEDAFTYQDLGLGSMVKTDWYVDGNEGELWEVSDLQTALTVYSSPQILATIPSPPTMHGATPLFEAATVTFYQPISDGGSAITGYKVKVYEDGTEKPLLDKVSTDTTPNIGNMLIVTVPNLKNGLSYTFKVVATNDIGDSEESAESNEVTPGPSGFITASNGDGTLKITGYNGTVPTELVIPEVIDGKLVTHIDSHGFAGQELESIVLPPSIIEIGDHAFRENQLQTITIPASVKKIGESSFAMNQLTRVTFDLGGNLVDIGNSAFYLNELENIIFPSSVQTIGGSAFSNNKLKKVEFKQPESPLTVGFGAFNNQEGNMWTKWYINGNLIDVWYDYLPVTTALTIYSTVQTLHEVTFETYDGSPVDERYVVTGELLTKPTDPIKDGFQFDGWYRADLQTPWNFETDTVTEPITLHAKWKAAGPFTTSTNNDGTLKITGYNGTVPTGLVIPAEINGKLVSIIGSTAFMFENLTSVVIPEGVKKIETSAFSGNFLTNVVIPSTMEEIASTAFKGNKLETVEFKGAVSTIDGSAFVAQDITPEFTGWYTERSMQPSTLWNGTVPQAMTIYSTGIVGYMVTFNTNGGSDIAPKFVTQGESITAPPAPTRAGYTFVGWYKDSAFQTAWNFTTDKVTENTTLYAKWTAVPTTNPPMVTPPSGSNTTPSTTTEIRVDVVDASNPDAVLVQTIITRETSNGVVKDTVNFTLANAREAIEKLANQENKQSRMVIPDEQQQVSETNISIGREAAELLTTTGTGLGIDMATVKLDIPATSFANINSAIYFRVVPVKAQATKQQLEQRAKTEEVVKQLTSTTVTLLGQPMTIETNMQNRPVTLTLPLPNDVTQEQLESLVVYIEHSDGTKEVVRGQIVDFKEGTKGIQFDVTKFSTFTILYAPVEKEETVMEKPVAIPYIQGYADGTFRPNASVTRAQMASMLARHLTNDNIPTVQASFKDTEKHGAKDAIEYVKAQGLFQGTTATTFNPNGTITRAQMAAVVVRWMEQQGTELPLDAKSAFVDVKANHWAAEAIAKVNALGIMTGTSDTTFNPEGALTRAQAVKVLNQLFELEVQASERVPLFKDVTSAHWAFDDIQAAAKK